jgi:hypothetical protein
VITAVDTNILLDILIPRAPEHDDARQAIIDSEEQGAVVIGEAVYAELAAEFGDEREVSAFLARIRVDFAPSDPSALFQAGLAWRDYTSRRPANLVCPACGNDQTVTCVRCGANLRPRQHVVADFLIGGHAMVAAGRLLTRDRGFYGTYFPDLKLA